MKTRCADPRAAPRVTFEFSFASIAAEKQRVAVLRQHGYRSVFDQRGYTVLHRASAMARPGLSKAAGR